MLNKRRPVPERCPNCGRLPVIVKIKPGRWRVACPFPNCQPMIDAVGKTEEEAVRNWDEEAKKK